MHIKVMKKCLVAVAFNRLVKSVAVQQQSSTFQLFARWPCGALAAGAPAAPTAWFGSAEWESCLFPRGAASATELRPSRFCRDPHITKSRETEPQRAWPLKQCPSHLHLIYIQVWAAVSAINYSWRFLNQMTAVTPARTRSRGANTDVPAQCRREEDLVLIPSFLLYITPFFHPF